MSSNKSILTFSALGHLYFHMFTAFYFVIVLSLETEWQLPYHELIDLWTFGALLVGLFALIAGWLGDKWSAPGMLIVYFIGMGLCAIVAGFSQNSWSLWLALSGIGLFAAIYHPIGIPLVIRNSTANQGKALAINGVFGSLGAALAGLVTGFLIDLGGRWLAFVLPGIIVTLTGILMWFMHFNSTQNKYQQPITKNLSTGNLTPFLILLGCFTLAGLIYHCTQTVLPKVFSVRVSTDIKTVGIYVAIVYTLGGLFQFVGGWLADRYNLKLVYLYQFAAHAILLWIAATLGGLPLVAILCAAVAMGAGALPVENLLLARHTPAKHHGVVFGLKFVLFFGTGPLGVLLVAAVNRHTGQFVWVFLLLTIVAWLICLAAMQLPRRTANQT